MNVVIPKHKQIKNELISQIRLSSPDFRLPSIRSMMQHFKTTQSTIEKCLDELEVEKLIYRKRGAGVFVSELGNSDIKMKTTVGVIVENLDNHYNSLVISGIMREAEKNNFNIVVYSNNNNFTTELNSLHKIIEQGLNAAIIIPNSKNLGNTEYIDSLRKIYSRTQIPFVFVDYIPQGIHGDLITTDNFESTRKAMSQAIESGSKQVNIILSPHSNANLERLRGIEKAIKDSGQEIKVNCHYVENAHINNRKQYAEILKSMKDTLFILMPSQIEQIIMECNRNGLLPGKDINIISFVEEGYEKIINENISVLIKPSKDIGKRTLEIAKDRFLSNISKNIIIERHKPIQGGKQI